MTVTISVDTREWERFAKRVSADLPAAIATGINRTADAVEQHELIAMERDLDRPTPFTLNAIGKYRATRQNPAALLFIRPIQWEYLKLQVKGGARRSLLKPVKIRLDRYGNIPGKRDGIAGIVGRGVKRFAAEINGTYGVWERYGRGGQRLRLLVALARNQQYRKRWDFFGIAARVANERLERDVKIAIDNLLRDSYR